VSVCSLPPSLLALIENVIFAEALIENVKFAEACPLYVVLGSVCLSSSKLSLSLSSLSLPSYLYMCALVCMYVKNYTIFLI